MSNKQTTAQKRPKYVIINDCDAPQPRMVCQWIPGVGYCYMDRRDHKSDFDGMSGAEATPVESFGFVWVEDTDGYVRFYLADNPPHPVTATYRDGKPRRWQDRQEFFEWRQLKPGAIKVRKSA